MSVVGLKTPWQPWRIGRKKYFLFAGLLVALIAFMPIYFALSAGPAAGWLLLFTARIRDIGRQIWSIPSLILVGLEMFTKYIATWVHSAYGREWTGYFIISLIITHILFAIALGVQRTKTEQAVP